MAGGLGCHHITLRPTRLPENRELVNSASSPAHQPKTDKLRNMGQARELGGGRGDALKNARPALSADGLQGPSPLTGFWVAFFHDPVQHPSTFFFNDDMALRSLRVLDLVSSEWRQHFVRFEFFWSPDTQTRSFFHLAPGSDPRHAFWIARLSLRWSARVPSPLPFSPLRHEPLVCRACFLYMMHEPRSPTKSTRMGQWTRPDDGQAMRSATGGQ